MHPKQEVHGLSQPGGPLAYGERGRLQDDRWGNAPMSTLHGPSPALSTQHPSVE